MAKSFRASTTTGRENFKLHEINYFHPYIRREFCDEILTNEGDFLVRIGHGNTAANDYVISVKIEGDVKHCKANKNNQGEYYFCYDDTCAVRLSDLIATHYSQRLPVGKEGDVKIILVRPVSCPAWIFRPDQIEVKESIGHGSISDVYRGVLTSNSGSEDIALKVLRAQDQNSMADLMREARVLRYLKHPNVVGWKGIVIKKDVVMLVLEYVNYGSLHDSLDKLSLRGKIKALLEVAKGLQYLHHEQVYHRNIAARNILVKYENNVMITKISDLCLCRSGGARSRYTMEGSHAVPTAWTAPECLVSGEWTTASDVWSYGVLTWEIFSEGESPYKQILAEISVKNLKNYLLVLKKRLPQPKSMPVEVVEIMNSCFKENPEERPMMSDIITRLQKIYDFLRGSGSPAS